MFEEEKRGTHDRVEIGRHSLRSDKVHSGETKYEGLADVSIDQLREDALPGFIELVDSAEPGAIVAITGASEETRAKSTGEIIGDLLQEHYRENKDVLVITRSEIDTLLKQQGQDGKHSAKLLDRLGILMASNPDKKIVFTRPLFQSELSMRPYLYEPHGSTVKTPFSNFILQAGKKEAITAEEQRALDRTRASRGNQVADYDTETIRSAKAYFKMTDEDVAPYDGATAQQIALQTLRGVNRMRDFLRKQIDSQTGPHDKRQLVIGMVGHGLWVDAFFSYLANKGHADLAGFEKFSNEEGAVRMGEFARIDFGEDDEHPSFSFRGYTHEIPKEILNG